MKGGTLRSLPHSYAVRMDKASKCGIRFDINLKNHWLSLALMQVYVTDILVPYFLGQKLLLGLLPDTYCILQLDVWSVHRSYNFCKWVYDTFPWIILSFVPGGLTGLWQVCNVGIQNPLSRPFVRRSSMTLSMR
jgi:hypothetical protein